jgi:hypothetical protein
MRDGGVMALAVLILIGVGLTGLFARRRARGRIDVELWPWMIAEVGVASSDGRGPCEALLGVALHGPPPLRAAARSAVDVWRTSGDPVVGIRALQRTVADRRLDRICRTVEAVQALDGDAGAALARLAATAAADAARDRRRRRHLRSLHCAAWLALAPVVAVTTGHLGAAAGAIAVAAAVTAWGAWFVASTADGVRVLDGHS